jgi:hypothetical protein
MLLIVDGGQFVRFLVVSDKVAFLTSELNCG